MKFLIISIKHASQINENEICKYFTEDVWKKFLHHFLEVLDEYATFTDDFKQVWKKFMGECLKRMVIEIVEHKKLIEIKDLNHLTIGYDIYDVTNSLRLNDEAFKKLVQKELDKMISRLQ